MILTRPARIEDRESIANVCATVTGTSLSLTDDEWGRWLELGGIVIAEEEDQVVGFGSIDVTAVEQIKWLYLLPRFQHRGLGSRILDELENLGWLGGLQSIRLHSTPNAVGFYTKRGYTPVSTHEQIGHDHDGVEMVKRRPRFLKS